MNRRLIALILMALAFLFSNVSALAGTTAKTGLAQAAASAKKWQADAVVTSISTLAADSNGTSDKWSYMFYSPKAKKGYTVDIRGAKLETLEVNPYVTDSIGNDFVDSDKAMQEAKKNGLKTKDKPAMSLMLMGQATKQPGVYWSVGGGYLPGDVSIMVEAKTGKFAHRQQVK